MINVDFTKFLNDVGNLQVQLAEARRLLGRAEPFLVALNAANTTHLLNQIREFLREEGE